MDIFGKLKILTDAAKYDVACTSSGVDRGHTDGALGTAVACGICHTWAADGRCVSLLKILQTNNCIYDCKYCVNRTSSDVPRAMFTPEEIGELTINFYRRNYIEGLFLSSAVFRDPDYTMELMTETVSIVRNKYKFAGYIHMKAIPGASPELIARAGRLADRMSVNIEMPSNNSLMLLAPNKKKDDILRPMRQLAGGIEQSKREIAVYRNAPSFVPAGQSTQMVIGASPESDKQIMSLSESLYDTYKLKRVFYSAYNPVGASDFIPDAYPPLLREHRLYQADWLLRFYGFNSREIFEGGDDLNLNMDPKCAWAIRNIGEFPVEINTAKKELLMRVPGIGTTSVQRILSARRGAKLTFDNLKKMGIVLKRAKYFITCGGKMMERYSLEPDILNQRLSEHKISERYEQMTLFEKPLRTPQIEATKAKALIEERIETQTDTPPLPLKEDFVKCVTGQI